MPTKIQLGKLGEQVAAKYLKNQGYKILEKNYRTRYGEIDLICEKEQIIHFIEVKTRTNQNFGWPEEAVNQRKIEKIIKVAEKYLEEHELDLSWQIDIISLLIKAKERKTELKHFSNINT